MVWGGFGVGRCGGLVVGGGGADDTGVDPASEPTVLEWAVQPATATAAAMVNAAMIRTGRMATSPLMRHGP